MNIEKLEPTIDLLVKKYNYGKLDEDLKQDAWVCALEAEQKYPNVSEEEFIKIVSVCVQNMFKDKLRKRKLETINIPEDFDFESNIDLLLFLTELKDTFCLTLPSLLFTLFLVLFAVIFLFSFDFSIVFLFFFLEFSTSKSYNFLFLLSFNILI